MHQGFWYSSDWSRSDAEDLANALKILVADARRNLDEYFSTEFETSKCNIQTWRAQQPNAPMPEEARRHKVLAEAAFRDKDLDNTAGEYGAAVSLYPYWPEGEYNAAIAYGAVGLYPRAIYYMKLYLEVSPDAPDALAARNQIIIWQNKMGE